MLKRAIVSILLLSYFAFDEVTSLPRLELTSYNNEQQKNVFSGLSLTKLGPNYSVNQGKVVKAYEDQLQSLDQYEVSNYDFKYAVHGGGNQFGHQESRLDSNARGQYHVLLPDGRRQIVTYYADQSGYHPTITYELSNSLNSIQSSPIENDGYRSKRHYKHSKRVILKHPVSFKSLS